MKGNEPFGHAVRVVALLRGFHIASMLSALRQRGVPGSVRPVAHFPARHRFSAWVGFVSSKAGTLPNVALNLDAAAAD